MRFSAQIFTKHNERKYTQTQSTYILCDTEYISTLWKYISTALIFQTVELDFLKSLWGLGTEEE